MDSRMTLAAVALLLISLIAGAAMNLASGTAAPVQYVQSTSVYISSDGEAAINQTLVIPQNSTSVTVPLISPQVGDILAVDQSGSAESYQIGNGSITIYTLGDSSVSLTYYTNSLTTKQGSVWTVSFSWNSNSTLELPFQSTILSLSNVPVSVSERSGNPFIVLGPGSWQVSYGLPIGASSTQTSSSEQAGATISGVSSVASSTSSSTGAPSTETIQATLVLIALAAVVAAAAGILTWRKRRSGPTGPGTLRSDDLEMLRFIRDKGGKVVEAEIRERFEVPRTTAWRQTRRLEQLGYIRVKKLGSQNQLELVRNDFS